MMILPLCDSVMSDASSGWPGPSTATADLAGLLAAHSEDALDEGAHGLDDDAFLREDLDDLAVDVRV